MTCLAFYYVPDTVFPEAGMRTGMCCCSASAQREKNLSCYHAPAKRRERMRKERERRVMQGSWGWRGGKVAQAKITLRKKKQPITIKRTLGTSEISSALSGRLAAFHWPVLSLLFSRLWFSLQLLWCSELRLAQRLHNCRPVIGAASLNPSPASLPLFFSLLLNAHFWCICVSSGLCGHQPHSHTEAKDLLSQRGEKCVNLLADSLSSKGFSDAHAGVV